MNSHPLLLLLAGPAGTGKTTLCEKMLARHDDRLQRVITATTRPPRPGEADGADYYFFSRNEFERRIQADDFYEYAIVHGQNYYGTLKQEFTRRLGDGMDLIMNIDVQGASTFRRASRTDPSFNIRLVTIFVMPADLTQIKHRLLLRNPGLDREIDHRLDTALQEMNSWRDFDYCFTTASRESDLAAVEAIYAAEKMRVIHKADDNS